MRIPTFTQFQNHADRIAKQFDEVNQLMIKMSSGKKIQSSSEDPVLASKIKSQRIFLQDINNYYNNGLLAQNRLQLFSSSIQNTLDVINDVQTQIKKAQSGSLSDQNRSAIAEQLRGDLSLILSYANTSDADNSYIYSGFNSNAPPYVLVNGSYQYQGGHSRATIDIAPDVSAMYFESGFNVFSDIYTGNGRFTITASAANTGAASTSPGTITNQANYVADTYTLTFVTNSAGELAYQVIGAASGQVVPPPPATIPGGAPKFDPQAGITFNGITFDVSGTPKAGDVFTVQPSSQKNIFNTMQDLINTLQSPVTNQGLFDQTLSQLGAAFTQITAHLSNYQSQVGTMAASVDNQVKSNDATAKNAEIVLSGLEDAHVEEVISALMQKKMALETTTESFAKLQEILSQILRL